MSADVVARYLRLKGEEVLFVSGSDEHGTPIELEALKRGVPPKTLTDENHEKIKGLFRDWEISFDNYTRTENPIHIRFVQDFFLKLYKNGYIFTEEIEFPYCPNCKRFLPDRFIEGTCPRCGYAKAKGDQCEQCGWPLEPLKLINPRCTVCGGKPETKETKHWYFDLPKVSDRIKKYIEENDRLPDNAKNFSLSLIKEGLKPRPITRDNDWGIPAPFPGAQKKTIYVWVEALLGYVSATIEYFKRVGEEDKWREYWFNHETRTLYFVGKDNIPFHTIILPGLLIASEEGYNLPWTVSSTEFLLFKGQKFSKSHRVGVWIDEALKLYPADYWRYTLIAIRPETRDTNFTWEVFVEKVNSDLNDTLGNFIHRTLTFIHRYFDSKIPKPAKMDEYDLEVLENIRRTKFEVEKSLESFRLQSIVSTIMGFAHSANKYINDKEPWKTIKVDYEKASTTLYVAIHLVKALAVFLQLIIPKTSEEIFKILGLDEAFTWWDRVEERIEVGHKINKPKLLFKKVSLKEVEKTEFS